MGSKISDWNKVGWGKISMSTGFTYSSNTLMMHLQDLVGSDKMKEWYEKFGFGKSTKSMFDGESTGGIAWDNEAQQNILIWSIYNRNTSPNVKSAIRF